MSTRNLSRKEEIEIAIPKNKFGNFHKQVAYEFGFQQGAEWADRTMLDKVCEWLMLNADDYIFEGVEEYSSAMRHDFIENFRKAMED